MKPITTALTAALLSISSLTLASADVSACSVPPPYNNSGLQLMPTGDVAQGAQLSVSTIGWGSPTAELLDSDGQVVPFEPGQSRCQEFATQHYDTGQRCVLEPSRPLAPGQYRWRLSETRRQQMNDPDADLTFTVLPEFPPASSPPAPTIEWRVVSYTDRQDPPFNPFPFDSCAGISDDSSRAWLKIQARVDDPDARGHFVFTLEREGDDPLTGATFTSSPPNATWLLDRYYYPSEFFTCVSATFVDVYGRSSEPTRSCRPDGCEVRDKNDRGEIDWADVQGCGDWSPGWAERNPPGCGCAQAPGAPASTPLALALLALGLLGMIHRANEHH